MSTTKTSGAPATTNPKSGVDTKQGADKAAATLTPKTEEKKDDKKEPALAAVETKPTVETILKRLPILNSLQAKLTTIEGRNDQLLNAQARLTGESETLTISFGKGIEPIVISNPAGIAKSLDFMIEENEKIIAKAKREIEDFTF